MRSILICSMRYGGCGYIASNEQFISGDQEGNIIICPQCTEYHIFQLTKENLISLTNDNNFELAQAMLDPNSEPARRVVGQAKCGCVHHAEEGIPCEHDLALLKSEIHVHH